jgi:opacity protein-like surface antigen
MNKWLKPLILSGSALVLFSGAALAADIAPPPEPVLGGFYVGAFGGATWFSENGVDFAYDGCEIADGPGVDDCHPDISGDVSLDTDTGFLIGGVLGYHWGGTGLRSELEVSYSQANLDGFDVDWDSNAHNGQFDDILDDSDFDGDVSVTYIFGNLWYGFGDVLNMGGISPYVGGGLGVGFVNVDVDSIEGVGLDASGDETGFAYQLGGGLMWSLTDNVALDLGYRWRGVMLDDYDEDLNSNNVLLGLNVGF